MVAPTQTLPPRTRRRRRALLWVALTAGLVVAQTLLVLLTLNYEETRAQDEVEAVAAETSVAIRRDMIETMRVLQGLMWSEPVMGSWREGAAEMLRARREVLRVERRDAALAVTGAIDSGYVQQPFDQLPRQALDVGTANACNAARRTASPVFSPSYFLPLRDGRGVEVIDVCIPLQQGGRDDGFLVGCLMLPPLLEGAMTPQRARRHEMSFVEGDGTRVARAGQQRGAGVFVSERVIDLPGANLRLRVDSASGRPSLIPNLSTALVLGLSIGLFALLLLLARDVRRRAAAERALAEALAFRQAMEDSLITGLRARDLEGRITYANPAFCAMVGLGREDLAAWPPPYWPPEFTEEYTRRQHALMSGRDGVGLPREGREGFETVFMRRNGERFPVMIYEAPLVGADGLQTGWMSAVLDISAQRRAEELSRQQQDRLQASARLATVGEMASLLSHELNQPLAAISSYAAGSLNLLDEAGAGPLEPQMLPMLREAVARVAAQAERAGRVIGSVHDFVRRREQQRETVDAARLFDSVMPLVRLQARKSGTAVRIDMPVPAPSAVCDRTMVEQVLLNLARNGIQAMETLPGPAARVLVLGARPAAARWVMFTVRDAGSGIPPEVASRLFTPFFTTRTEGMGLGLSLCRTVVEQHGGVLDFGPGPGGRGTEFRFTLPAPPSGPEGASSGETDTRPAAGGATDGAAPAG